MRTIISLTFLLVASTTVLAQPNFRLSTSDMPRLEEAIAPLPAPLKDAALRESLEAGKTSKPTPKADEVLKQVVNSLKTREFEGSLARLEYLQSLRPADLELLILRGCIYAESGHPQAAEGIFRRAIMIAPTHPWARLNLAEALMTEKKYGDAEKTLALLSSTRPESEVVRFKLILALVLQKKFAPANEEIKFLEEHVTTPAYYYARASVAFSQGNGKLGQEMIAQAKKNYSDVQTSYFYNALAAYAWVPAQ